MPKKTMYNLKTETMLFEATIPENRCSPTLRISVFNAWVPAERCYWAPALTMVAEAKP